MIDVIVVGSGPGGVNAAVPLVGAGLRVVLLDYGRTDARYAPIIATRDFTELRHADANQHRYFLGDEFEGVPFGPVRVGAQLTPPRQHVAAGHPRLRVDTDGFAVVHSLARGGLGAAWAAGVFPFTDAELRPMGLGLADMRPHYDRVCERVGVSGGHGDLGPFFPTGPNVLPGLDLGTNAECVLARYERKRAALNAAGFFLGRPPLAVCTERHRERGPEGYHDMTYWADLDQSVYRPQWTLAELEQAPNFTYVDGRLVQGFRETDAGVSVEAVRDADGTAETHEARALVLAAGTFGTSRIVLRSLGRFDTPVPILCNPYTYVPTVNLFMLGRPSRDRRHSLAQLTAMMRAGDGSDRWLQSQVFSYRSLLTFKLMKELPLGYRPALHALRVLMPAFTILGMHHEDHPTADKRVTLRRADGDDVLEVRYRPTDAELARQHADERRMLGFFLRLGCVPLKAIRPGHGANMHYAGTFPIVPEGGELTCERDGRLRATRNVYLADGSVFPWLPPKGLTFNIMANADRVGTGLAERLTRDVSA
jgi:hypothetical protein